MLEFKRILFPTDFSDHANQALRYASVFSDRFGSKLTLFHVIALFQDDPHNPEHHFPNLQDFYDTIEKHAKTKMGQFDLLSDTLETQIVTARGISPAEEIVNFADSNGTDLIVMGTHGRTAISHFMMGSVAEKVIRHAKCSVLTVSHQEKEMFELPKIRNILVPVDFSEHSKYSLKYASSVAGVLDANIQFLHAVDQRVHPAFYVMGEQSIFQIYPDLMERSMTFLKDFVKDEIPSNLHTDFFVREGNPHTEIVNFAKHEGTDLIVMGTHGLSGLEKLLIGSTTEKVVRKAHVPVLAVKPDVN